MKHITVFTIIFLLGLFIVGTAQTKFESDVISTSQGDLQITFIGHGTLMFQFKGLVVHVDPVSRYADYSKMPKADLVLVTHHHGDHLDPSAIDQIRKQNTEVICTKTCAEKIKNPLVMNNGDSRTVQGIGIRAVPAYNLVHKRDNGEFFHPKGIGNGYVITFGDKHVYIAGDTENVPEMKNLGPIEIAFIPMNLPYTMTPEMTADAVRMVQPKIFYPYHYGNSDTGKLTGLLKDMKDCEIRIRPMN